MHGVNTQAFFLKAYFPGNGPAICPKHLPNTRTCKSGRNTLKSGYGFNPGLLSAFKKLSANIFLEGR